MCRGGGFFSHPRKIERRASFRKPHQGSGIWGHKNCCHSGFCTTLLMPCRCPIGHSQGNTKFLFMCENRWHLFVEDHPERCSPVSLWAAALCLSNIPHFVHTSLNVNTRPSPGPNLTLWFLCGCNESIKNCTMMSYSASETETSSESHLALLRVATDGTFSGSCVCFPIHSEV